MPRVATGELRRLASGFAARITIEGRDRRDFPLPTCASEGAAKERTAALAAVALRLRRAGHAAKLRKLVAMGAKARAGRPWNTFLGAVDVLCQGTVEAITDVPTFEYFAKDWTQGELARRFPDHVRSKRSAERDEQLLRLYILPHVKEVRLDEFRLADAEFVMANLPAKLSPGTRRH
ncbi:MAG: hypothetical protein ACRENE_25625, partial [Polyangiaceae bacterium]